MVIARWLHSTVSGMHASAVGSGGGGGAVPKFVLFCGGHRNSPLVVPRDFTLNETTMDATQQPDEAVQVAVSFFTRLSDELRVPEAPIVSLASLRVCQ